MNRRVPPSWQPRADGLARDCGIATVSFGTPIPDGTWCHYCGLLADSRDHIVADSAGGVKSWWNLVPSCLNCNNEKADRQSCSCLFCLRAMALWHLGYRRSGMSYRDKRTKKKQRSTDMDDDSVIEEAAKAIARSRGDVRDGEQDRISARAAFAVFEKAHAPADDEREAARRLLGDVNPKHRPALTSLQAEDIRMVATATLRRSEVSAP